MSNLLTILIAVLAGVTPVSASVQPAVAAVPASVQPKATERSTDSQDSVRSSIVLPADTSGIIYYQDLNWKPTPSRAVWLGILFPGLGQIYNRSYWKLPIVYGGLMGCAYAIAWNNGRYLAYRQAYMDISADATLSTDPTRSYNAILKEGYTVATMGGKSTYTQTLRENTNIYHRYRDIGIVVAVLVYALSVVDAFVDAQLFDFDISPDLSMHVEPGLNYDLFQSRSAEVKLAFTF